MADTVNKRKERINYFDIAKGIGIILVVLGHLEYISLELRYAIVSFHMPLFFVVSGMLMNVTNDESKEIGTYIRSKAKRILMPYMYFSIIYLFIIVGLIFISPDTYTWVYFYENAYLAGCMYGISVLWFLPALFFASIIFVAIRKKVGHYMTIVLVAIITISAYLCNYGLQILNISHGKEFVFFHLNIFLTMILRSLISVMFICVGYYFYKLIENIKVKSVIDFIIGIILLIPVVIISQKNQAVDIHFLVFNNCLLYLFCSCVGSMAVIFISRSLGKTTNIAPICLLKYYGENSLVIMATHMDMYVLYFSLLICNKIVDISNLFLFCLITILIVFIIEIVIIEIINRFFPFIVGKKRV